MPRSSRNRSKVKVINVRGFKTTNIGASNRNVIASETVRDENLSLILACYAKQCAAGRPDDYIWVFEPSTSVQAYAYCAAIGIENAAALRKTPGVLIAALPPDKSNDLLRAFQHPGITTHPGLDLVIVVVAHAIVSLWVCAAPGKELTSLVADDVTPD